MGEIDYWALYGVEKPDSGDEGQNTAAEGGGRPTGSAEALRADPPDGGTTPSVSSADSSLGEAAAEGAEDEDTEEREGAPDAQAQEAGQGRKKPQSREENARFAAARRKQERDAAVQQARDEERRRAEQDMDALIAGMGLENPYTGEKITTKAGYDEYQAKHREKEHESRLRDMHMNQQEYDEMIAGLPEVQEAKRVTEQAQRAEWDRRIREEIEQVSTLNPAIRSLEDLANDPRFEQVKGYLDRGMTIPEAYQLAHMDELTEGKARQKAINQAGKSHLSATRARGSGGLDVPDEVLQDFRAFNPNATREEVAAYINRRHGGK